MGESKTAEGREDRRVSGGKNEVRKEAGGDKRGKSEKL